MNEYLGSYYHDAAIIEKSSLKMMKVWVQTSRCHRLKHRRTNKIGRSTEYVINTIIAHATTSKPIVHTISPLVIGFGIAATTLEHLPGIRRVSATIQQVHHSNGNAHDRTAG